ncbi:MAG: hypothetical protein IT452_09865 [Planctomycetia bacterium]|nr:hypothetical protein [Planctomycetia bacterium]
MDRRFRRLIETLDGKVDALIAMPPVTAATLPSAKQMPKSGIYLFSQGKRHLYVGRSKRIRQRLGDHSRPSARQNQASFAFLLASKRSGRGKAAYTKAGSREALLENDRKFAKKFVEAKAEVRCMDVRFIAEKHPLRQALLEIYAAVRLRTPHNDFDTH